MASGKDKRPLLAAIAAASAIGFNMAGSVAAGVLLGRALDHWLGVTPWATVGGSLCGMLAGLWSAYKKIMAE